LADELKELQTLVGEFARERDWGQFHLPRNLVLALVGEVGELASEFQWLSDDMIAAKLEDGNFVGSIGAELADVLSYLLRLSDVLGIDLADELRKKIAVNEVRYPADKSRGSSDKYTSYE
jgi:dCTP diphosphatase